MSTNAVSAPFVTVPRHTAEAELLRVSVASKLTVNDVVEEICGAAEPLILVQLMVAVPLPPDWLTVTALDATDTALGYGGLGTLISPKAYPGAAVTLSGVPPPPPGRGMSIQFTPSHRFAMVRSTNADPFHLLAMVKSWKLLPLKRFAVMANYQNHRSPTREGVGWTDCT